MRSSYIIYINVNMNKCILILLNEDFADKTCKLNAITMKDVVSFLTVFPGVV